MQKALNAVRYVGSDGSFTKHFHPANPSFPDVAFSNKRIECFYWNQKKWVWASLIKNTLRK